jgi:uncharacterized delta-60 repeat protein
MKTLLPHKKTLLLLMGVSLCLLQSVSLRAQSLDFRFRSPVAYDRAEIISVLEQSDKKILIGGEIAYFGSRRVEGDIVRLTAGGSLDRSFNSDFEGWPIQIASFKDGGYLVNDDDNLIYLDKTGKVVEDLDTYVEKLLVLPDNSFLVYGDSWIAKYTSDFQIDESFGDGGWIYVNGNVVDMELQGSQIIIAGDFDHVEDYYDYYAANDLARLNMDGTVDTNFDAGSGTGNYFGSITVQSDGKILLGQSYINSFDDHWFGGTIVRLNSDGSVDEDFYSPWFGWVGDLGYKDGRILVPSETLAGIFSINNDGSTNEDFNEIYFGELSDELVVYQFANGEFAAANAPTTAGPYGIHRFKTNGTRYTSFKPAISTEGWINDIIKSGSHLFVSGDFFKLNGVVTNSIGRLQLNGNPDASFHMNQDLSGGGNLGAFSDGSILVQTGYGPIRLNADGTWGDFDLDTSWPNAGSTEKFHIQADDKVILLSPYGIVRRNSDGSADESFTSQENNIYYGYWSDFDVQSDGKIIYGGNFTALNGTSVNRIARLNTDGTIDNSFDPGSGPSNLVTGSFTPIRSVDVGANDYILIKGYFNYYNGINTNSEFYGGNAVLTPDGALYEEYTDNLFDSYIYTDYGQNGYAFRNGFTYYGYNYDAGMYQYNFIGTDGIQPAYSMPASLYIDYAWQLYASDDQNLYVVGYNYVRNSDDYTQIVRLRFSPLPAAASVGREAVSTMRVFPNPSTDFVSFDISSPVRINILSMDGAVKIDKQISSKDDLINVSNLKPGRYIVKVSSNGKVRTEHLIKN